MRSTLFFIPHEIAGISVFGWGWALAIWILGSVLWLGWNFSQRHPKSHAAGNDDLMASLPVLGVGAFVIIFILPSIEQAIPGSPPLPLGLPIRGYGVMVLIGLLCGIGITIIRGKQLGISPDTIISLGFWMMIGGVLGARIFYVIQKWDEFASHATAWDQLAAILKLTEGGLVIYGGVFGGIAAGALYCRLHRLPLRAVGDLIAPAFLIGYAFGRIGCLLNGCCFGGICLATLPTITFPQGSGPYVEQLVDARLLGAELNRTAPGQKALPASVTHVDTNSLAEKMGIKPGSTITGIEYLPIPHMPGDDPAAAPYVEALVQFDDKSLKLASSMLPARSLPVHPSQIYAAINAALLCWLIWRLQPVCQRDGMTFLIAIALYGSSRFILEGIRSDEAGQLGTNLSIAQWIGLTSLLVCAILMLLLRRLPPGRKWDWNLLDKAEISGEPTR